MFAAKNRAREKRSAPARLRLERCTFSYHRPCAGRAPDDRQPCADGLASVTSFVRGALSQPKALCTRPLFPAARQILEEAFLVKYWSQPERISRGELLKQVIDKEALICSLTERIDEELLAGAPRLRIVATVSVGY